MSVVALERHHIPRILDLIKEGLANGYGGSFAKLTPDYNRARHIISAGLSVDKLWGAVALSNDTVIGFMLCSSATHWLFEEHVANEELLYIHPDHRTGGNALRLIRHCVEETRRRGYRTIYAGTSIEYRTDAVEKLYHLAGFKTIGMKFNLEL